MDRFFARNRLSALIDGDLPLDEAQEVKRAISRNPDLSAEHAAMVLTRKLMRKEGPVSAPRGFHARVMTHLATEPATGSQVAWLRAQLARVPMEAAVLAAAAIVIGIVVHQRQAPDIPAVAVAPTAAKAKRAAKVARVAKAPAAPAEDFLEPDIAQPKGVFVPVAGPGTAEPSDEVPPGRVGYRFLGRGDEVLYEIGTLADEVGGRLVDDGGETYRPHSLSEIRNFVRAFLVFPTSDAAKVHRRLRRQSGQDPHPVSGAIPTVLADESVVLIAVER
jgi:negative regulator of sigma E activity